MRIEIESFVSGYSTLFPTVKNSQPWEITSQANALVEEMTLSLDDNEYLIDGGIAIHKSATVETNAVLKAPVIIGENCFVAATAYLRGGVYLGTGTSVGPACEIKSSILLNNTTVAHFNFIGDSIVGNNVNIEAGAVFVTRYNERVDKRISLLLNGKTIETNSEKFGALVGDGSRIGANAVLSAGTILHRNSVVKRLELIEQVV